MNITLSDNLSQASVNPNNNTFEFKFDANPKSDGRFFGQLMSHVFQAQAEGSTDMAQKQTPAAEKAWQEIADPFTMASQAGMVNPQTVPSQFMTLKAVTLGPHMSVITPETSPPDSQSLQAFARAQGLDESAVNWLFGSHADNLNTPLNATLPGNPSEAPVVNTGSAIDVPQTMPNVQAGLPQVPLPTQTHFAASPLTATGNGQNTDPAAHWPGQAMTAAQVTPSANGQTTSSATHLLGDAMTAAQVLWAMADEPAQAPKPMVTHSTEELPTLPMLRMPPPAAVWMQRNVHQSAFQHFERAPKEAPVSLSELDLGDDWGGETLQLMLGAEGNTLSTDNQGTTGANLAYRLDPQTHNRNDPANTNGPAPELPDTKARSENIQNLAEKMGQAVGQRILSEMERGQWHLKLSLRPATLGHIEVEMKMRSGEFDAVFTAPNAVTRELLQEGLGKLKETLNQMGMNFASINVGDGKSGQSGENPTPGSFRSQPEPTEVGNAKTILQITTRAPNIKDPAAGLDVLV